MKTIVTDVKKDNLLVVKCREHQDLESEDIQKCSECRDLFILFKKVQDIQNSVEQQEILNKEKQDFLEQKDAKIKELTEEIEYKEGLLPKDQAPMTEIQELEFLMTYQIEASLVPISKLNESGAYLFGTKKMFVKVLEHELMVRVGGGYVDINEYLLRYTDTELVKIQKQLKKESVPKYENLEIYQDLVVKSGMISKNKEPLFVPLLKRSQNI